MQQVGGEATSPRSLQGDADATGPHLGFEAVLERGAAPGRKIQSPLMGCSPGLVCWTPAAELKWWSAVLYLLSTTSDGPSCRRTHPPSPRLAQARELWLVVRLLSKAFGAAHAPWSLGRTMGCAGYSPRPTQLYSALLCQLFSEWFPLVPPFTMIVRLCPCPNSYVETLTPNVMKLGGGGRGVFGR